MNLTENIGGSAKYQTIEELRSIPSIIGDIKESKLTKLFRLTNVGELISVANKDEESLKEIQNGKDLLNKETVFAAKNILNAIRFILGENPHDIRDDDLKTTLNKIKKNTDSTDLKLYISDNSSRVFGLINGFKEARIKKLEEKNRELEEHAATDILTGLPNRRCVEQFLDYIVADNKRTETNYGIAIVDIDNFKSINDTYGHLVGDTVLVEIAKIFNNSIRATDKTARWGGEEFLIILKDGEMDDFNSKLNEVRENVEQKLTNNVNEVLGEGKQIDKPITISIGVKLLEKDITKEVAVEAADTALYQAKNNGKNCVEIAQ